MQQQARHPRKGWSAVVGRQWLVGSGWLARASRRVTRSYVGGGQSLGGSNIVRRRPGILFCAMASSWRSVTPCMSFGR
jgi:hypothetical protein